MFEMIIILVSYESCCRSISEANWRLKLIVLAKIVETEAETAHDEIIDSFKLQ